MQTNYPTDVACFFKYLLVTHASFDNLRLSGASVSSIRLFRASTIFLPIIGNSERK
jgi:hypothetical protein